MDANGLVWINVASQMPNSCLCFKITITSLLHDTFKYWSAQGTNLNLKWSSLLCGNTAQATFPISYYVHPVPYTARPVILASRHHVHLLRFLLILLNWRKSLPSCFNFFWNSNVHRKCCILYLYPIFSCSMPREGS